MVEELDKRGVAETIKVPEVRKTSQGLCLLHHLQPPLSSWLQLPDLHGPLLLQPGRGLRSILPLLHRHPLLPQKQTTTSGRLDIFVLKDDGRSCGDGKDKGTTAENGIRPANPH